jgi:two-component system response regulator NreC
VIGNTAITVLLADDHRLMRQGLRSLLDAASGIAVVGEAATGLEAANLVRELQPAVAVVDVNMPDLNGIEATRRIKRDSPGTEVIALSKHRDKRIILGMLQAGASGYLVKDCAFDELERAITAVASGRRFLSDEISDVVIEAAGANAAHDDALAVLSHREREVMQLLAKGNSSKETASVLGVSVKTIDSHRQHIMAKLDVASVAELTRLAIREGMVALED